MLKLLVIPALILLPSAINAQALDQCAPSAAAPAQAASAAVKKMWFRCAVDDILQDPVQARGGQAPASETRADNEPARPAAR